MKNDKLYLDNLVIMADGEYGYNVYFKKYSDYETSYYTSDSSIDDVIIDIKDKLKKLEENK